jgi:hypothetical protein
MSVPSFIIRSNSRHRYRCLPHRGSIAIAYHAIRRALNASVWSDPNEKLTFTLESACNGPFAGALKGAKGDVDVEGEAFLYRRDCSPVSIAALTKTSLSAAMKVGSGEMTVVVTGALTALQHEVL